MLRHMHFCIYAHTYIYEVLILSCFHHQFNVTECRAHDYYPWYLSHIQLHTRFSLPCISLRMLKFYFFPAEASIRRFAHVSNAKTNKADAIMRALLHSKEEDHFVEREQYMFIVVILLGLEQRKRFSIHGTFFR